MHLFLNHVHVYMYNVHIYIGTYIFIIIYSFLTGCKYAILPITCKTLLFDCFFLFYFKPDALFSSIRLGKLSIEHMVQICNIANC